MTHPRPHLLALLALVTAVCLSACRGGEAHRSSVPAAPVFIRVNVPKYYPALSSFMANATFTPDDINADRQNPDNRVLQTGYGGVLVHSLPSPDPANLTGIAYTAFDMACPNEADRNIRVYPDSTGVYAVCEQCGSRFELEYGLAASPHNPSRENLRRHAASRLGDILTVTQRYDH